MSGPELNQVLVGDVRRVLPQLEAGSVDCVVTSPPYFRLRDYGQPGQLGDELSVAAWTTQLRAVAADVERLLTPTGTLWLNLGDSYALHLREGAPRKSLLLGPERLALALIQDGWVLRNKIVWSKPSVTPTPAQDRLRCSWEVVYLLAKQPRYYFDLDAIREPHISKARPRPGAQALTRPLGANAAGKAGLAHLKASGRPGHPLGKNPGDVWRLATSNYRGDHPAMFPISLAARAIRAGCPERRCTRCRAPYRRALFPHAGGGVARGSLAATCVCGAPSEPGIVLDPFMGSGTTAIAADREGRSWLGVELSADYAALARERIAAARTAVTSASAGGRR